MSCNPADSQEAGQVSPSNPDASSSTLTSSDGDATSLYQYILKDKVWGTNLDPPESAKNVIKPWDERLSTNLCVQSNVDDQLTITVPFTCPVRIKSILINTGTGDFAPTRCRAFVNRPDGIDFEEADAATSDTHPADQPAARIASTLGHVGSGKAQADFALLHGQDGVVEYPVSVARFSNTNSVTIVLSHSNATTLSRFFFLGFRGTALQLNKDPSERLDIAAANAADKPIDGVREKCGAGQGLAGGSGQRTSPRFTVKVKDASRRIAEITASNQQSPTRLPRKSKSTNTSSKKGRRSETSQSPTKAQRTPAVSARNLPPAASTSTTPFGPRPVAAAQNSAPRRRSLSQPPPTEVLVRHLQGSSVTPAANKTFSGAMMRTPAQGSGKTPMRSGQMIATPARRTLGTPHRPGDHSQGQIGDRTVDRSHANLVQTPGTDKRKKRQDTLLVSAQRTKEKRRRSIWGVGGWGGGREESPMDLLRRLARAPGFVLPPTPEGSTSTAAANVDAAAMPPPGSTRRVSMAANVVSPRTKNSLASASARSSIAGQSTSTGRRSMLRPGESVPGNLTRDSMSEDSADFDESNASSPVIRPNEQSMASEVGAERKKSGVSMARGGIFAALAERGRGNGGRGSDAASRLSMGGDLSVISAATSGYREHQLEKSLAYSLRSGGEDYSFASSGGASLDDAAAQAMERLDELTRQSLFSNDAHLEYNENEGSFSTHRKSIGRSMSEPPAGDDSAADYSFVLPQLDSVQYSDEDEQDEAEVSRNILDATPSRLVDDTLSIIDSAEVSRGRADEASISRQDRSILSDSHSRTNIIGDDTDVMAEPDQALSDDGYITTESDLDDLSDGGEEGEARTRKLDLMDPKDLNALLKRRIVKKRKARVSPYTGETLPQLPASNIKDLFMSFANPTSTQASGSLLGTSSSAGRRSRGKLDKPTLEEVDEACHDFFGTFAQQLLAQSSSRTRRRGGGGTTVNESDVIAVLKAQGHVTQRTNVSALAHRLLPRELMDQMNLSRFAAAKIDVQTSLTSRPADTTVEEDEEDDETRVANMKVSANNRKRRAQEDPRTPVTKARRAPAPVSRETAL